MERRLLQTAIALACLVPLMGGAQGMIEGPTMVKGIDGATVPDLDSHMRYLSGLLFGIGLAFLSCIPRIEKQSARFGLLAAIVVIGGLARAWAAVEFGLPGPSHRFALIMELGVVPALALWQRRVAQSMA